MFARATRSNGLCIIRPFPITALRISHWRPGRAVEKSTELHYDGDISGAVNALEEVPVASRGPKFFAYRAGLYLFGGRVDEAKADIETAKRFEPALGLSLLSIVETAQNEKQKALELANEAVAQDSGSAVAWFAMAYARQALFDLKGALESQRKAVALEGQNALNWARLAELHLAFGDLDRAVGAAQNAARLGPDLARTQTVLGFAYLTRFEVVRAVEAFEKAIFLDQGDPLPRLGLGLAIIRQGDLEQGREAIEVAASLDPDDALVRSYLGKAYYEEKRDTLAEEPVRSCEETGSQRPDSLALRRGRKENAKSSCGGPARHPEVHSVERQTGQCTGPGCFWTATWLFAAQASRRRTTTSASSNWRWSKAPNRWQPILATTLLIVSWPTPMRLCLATRSPGTANCCRPSSCNPSA